MFEYVNPTPAELLTAEEAQGILDTEITSSNAGIQSFAQQCEAIRFFHLNGRQNYKPRVIGYSRSGDAIGQFNHQSFIVIGRVFNSIQNARDFDVDVDTYPSRPDYQGPRDVVQLSYSNVGVAA